MNTFLIFLLLQAFTIAISAPSKHQLPDDDVIPISTQYLKLLNKYAVGKPDHNGTTGLAVSRYSSSYSIFPEELGSYFEGDILFPMLRRNGVISSVRRWRNGVIPFIIEGDFEYYQWNIIERAFHEYHLRTCIRFVGDIHFYRELLRPKAIPGSSQEHGSMITLRLPVKTLGVGHRLGKWADVRNSIYNH